MKWLVPCAKKTIAAALIVTVWAGSKSVFTRPIKEQLTGDFTAKVNAVLEPVYKPDTPGAAVIVVKDGQTVFRKAYGIASLEFAVTLKPEMVFRLASITKQFTATAIMMLVDQHKLSVNDDITKFVPNYPTGGKKITVENLLTHSSGIKDYSEILWPQRMCQDFDIENLIEVFENEGLSFTPGTREAYSNSNYVLLGAIIERVSGKSYADFIEENIFKVLGMNHSFYERPQRIIPNRVSGYAKGRDGFVNAPFISVTQLYAAGALMSSVDDLELWDAALSSDKLISSTSKQRMFLPHQLSDGTSGTYGYGWNIEQLEGHLLAAHGGGINGFSNYVLRMPQDHLYIAILSNDRTAEVQPEYLAKQIALIAIGKSVAEPRVLELASQILETYVGQYQLEPNYILTVSRQDNRLFAQGTGEPRFELFPVSETDFVVKINDAQFTFMKDERGKITRLKIHQGGQDNIVPKIH